MLFLILGAMTLLFNCQKDEGLQTIEQDQVSSTPDLKAFKIGASEINANLSLKAQLEKLTGDEKVETIDAEGKTVVSTEHGFSIETDYATYIEILTHPTTPILLKSIGR